MLLSDFVIPASEAGCSFQLRDRVFLDKLATRVQQKVEQRRVRAPPRARAHACRVHACLRRLPAGYARDANVRCAAQHGLPQHAHWMMAPNGILI
jgi:hypothetical protein